MIIKPATNVTSYLTGNLLNIPRAKVISDTLGFSSNCKDDPCKVKNSWGFTVDGVACAIWDYKGSELQGRYSTFGPDGVFKKLFGANYSK